MFFGTDLIEFYSNEVQELLPKYHRVASGWIFDKVVKYNIQIANFAPNYGNENLIGQEPRDIPLGEGSDFNIGEYWKAKHALVVPQNKAGDPNCFLYAAGIALMKPEYKDKGRITNELKKYVDENLRIKGVRFPPNTSDIEHFEKLNNIKIHCMAAQVYIRKRYFIINPL